VKTDEDVATILIVDDDGPSRLAAEAVLTSLEYPIVTASSGAEALKRVAAQEFVMILMDVHMADLDGYQTTALLRQLERGKDVPVIFLTAVYNEPSHIRRGYALGAVDYISKPFEPDILRAKVQALVSLYVRGRLQERERAREMDRIKDIFLGAVGHDLRNPLSTIAMAAKLLVSHDCSESSHRSYAARVDRAATRMNQMIEDILDLTRKRFADGIPVAREPMDLGELCRSVLAELRVAHPKRELDLEVVGDLSGQWDPGRLARVVSNLVGNAVQHCEGSAVRVRALDQGDRAALIVHNEGAPIPREFLPRLFEPFRRGETSAEGMGLGLYIVREIVRAHGGTVQVTSNVAEGTAFTVTLPRRRTLHENAACAGAGTGETVRASTGDRTGA
jgi:two-component system sensor histidine kinase/response regulator